MKATAGNPAIFWPRPDGTDREIPVSNIDWDAPLACVITAVNPSGFVDVRIEDTNGTGIILTDRPICSGFGQVGHVQLVRFKVPLL